MIDYDDLVKRLLERSAWIYFTTPQSDEVKLMEEAAYAIKELSNGKENKSTEATED